MDPNAIEYARLRRDLPTPEMRRAIRRSAGLSMQQVADWLGVSRSAVALWEAGRRLPRPKNLAAYARLLGDLER